MTINFHVNKDIQNFHSQLVLAGYDKKNTASAVDTLRTYVRHNTKLNSDNFFSKIIYRIGQVFLSIFGCSDWQKAQKTIKPFYVKICKDSIEADLNKSPQVSIDQKNKNKVMALFNKIIGNLSPNFSRVSDKMLELFVRMNDLNLPENASDSTLQKARTDLENQIGLTAALEELTKRMRKELAKTLPEFEALGLKVSP